TAAERRRRRAPRAPRFVLPLALRGLREAPRAPRPRAPGGRLPASRAPGRLLPARRLLGALRQPRADGGVVPPARRDPRRRDPGLHFLRGRRAARAPLPVRGRRAGHRRGGPQTQAKVDVVPYDPAEIEPRWQAWWDQHATFRAPDGGSKPKYYVLDMFPYPSG